MDYSWEEIVKAVSIYSSSMAEFKTIVDELEYGKKYIYDYPGLVDILYTSSVRWKPRAPSKGEI